MADHKVLGNGRNGESPAWKLVRLWPIVLTIAAISGSIYVGFDNIKDLKASAKVHWIKIADNEDGVVAVDTKVQIIQYRLDSIDKALDEQTDDLKEILNEVKK